MFQSVSKYKDLFSVAAIPGEFNCSLKGSECAEHYMEISRSEYKWIYLKNEGHLLIITRMSKHAYTYTCMLLP